MKLDLQVLEASGLSHLNQHDDIYPYCVIQLSRSSQIQRTTVMDRTISPVWNAPFTFNVRHRQDSLKIFVKDCSRLRAHSVLATITLRLKDFEPGHTIDEWFTLTPVKGVKTGGQIHLMLRLEPLSASSRNSAPPTTPQIDAPLVAELKPECAPELKPEAGSEQLVIVEPVPVPESRQSQELSLLVISGDFGNLIDTTNPNELDTVETGFSDLRESPAKMYTADTMELLQLEHDTPIYGPHWALAKMTAFAAHRACDYFTEFAVSGCEKSTQSWVLAMKKFFSESNHDINRNRIQFAKDAKIGPLMSAMFEAYEATIAGMARKKTLVQARIAINQAGHLINAIADDPAESENYRKAESAFLKGCQSYTEREDGAFWRNLQGARLDSVGVNAAVSALGLSSLEHALNCYICNSFGSRSQSENVEQPVQLADTKKLRTSHSASSIQLLTAGLF
jgi:hypothetical protein